MPYSLFMGEQFAQIREDCTSATKALEAMRDAIRRGGKGVFVADEDGREFSETQLANLAKAETSNA